MQNSVTHCHVVGDEHDALGGLRQLDDPLLALRPEDRVAGREDLVDDQHVGIDRRRDREPEAGPHARRVGLDRRVDELADVGEVDDAGQPLLHRLVGHAEERAGEADVVAARQVGVEAGTERQQARHVADDVDGALVRLDDPGEDLEQRALAGAVRADDREALAVDEPERDVAEGPEVGRSVAPLQEVPERAADRRLAGQAEVVADAEARGRRSRSPASRRRSCGLAHRTFANDGSTRLKNRVASTRKTVEKISSTKRPVQSGGVPL